MIQKIVLLSIVFCYAIADTIPQQIHLALTGIPAQMVVGWMTYDDTEYSTVIYWEEGSNQKMTQNGTADNYYLVLPPYESPQIHFALLDGLQTDTKYFYQCGDPDGGWSNVSYFRTERTTMDKPFVIASIGDHGTSPNSIQVVKALLNAEQNRYDFDLLVHAGDISYANDEQEYWDIWGNMVQPFANHVPWMVAVGNHEILDDFFVAYQYRFRMPATESNAPEGNLYYSFNYGPVHFLMLDSESLEYWHDSTQFEWIQSDLASVDRSQTPWIIASWHTPWYCTNTAHYESGDDMRYYFEDLLNQYNVDLILNGHVHAYERSFPVYNGNVTEGAPVYITNGCGGTEEGLATGWHEPTPWSAHREAVWGIGTLQIFNATHMFWQFHRDTDLQVQDTYWFVKGN